MMNRKGTAFGIAKMDWGNPRKISEDIHIIHQSPFAGRKIVESRHWMPSIVKELKYEML
jgi:hypothetical protein